MVMSFSAAARRVSGVLASLVLGALTAAILGATVTADPIAGLTASGTVDRKSTRLNSSHT